ncbi:MAG: TonB-dependent receptor [Crocinitomicaceae bacterium]|nr:TonB-dependent receptor [Crocinitomicaceae bacterium]
MKYIILGIVFFACLTGAKAQLKGVVFGYSADPAQKKPIQNAKVRLVNSREGAYTGEDGTFELILPKNLPDTMIISSIGFVNDTVVVTRKDRFAGYQITLFSDQLLPETIIKAKASDHSILRLKVLHVENISSGELKKAACCNLSESFETNASVDVNITDAVSGAKKIQMMGLDGVYTQIQFENIPSLRGLESSFGLHSMPGTWVESIQITKGTGNVVNGYESMAGLVNIELKKSEEMERLYLNGYVNRFGRAELNFNTGFRLSEKWTSGWFAHASTTPFAFDENNDNFRDFPNDNNLAVFNRYSFEGEKMEAKLGVNAYWDKRVGGQTSFNGTNFAEAYGVLIDSRHIDAFAKTGFFLKKPLHSIGVVYNAKYQTVDATFGNRQFRGTEKRGYVNAIYDGIINNSTHKFKVGASGVYSDLEQQMDSLNDDRLEIVPGVFGEYTYSGARLSAVAGVRGDYHNIYGFQYAPRLHLKYAVTERLDLRGTVGKGWRVPNYMIDNISLLATGRTWMAPDTISPEISWNVGGSLVQRFVLWKRAGSITADFYHTQFENQMVVDRDADANAVVFNSLDGTSYSNSLQLELAYSPAKQLDLRFAYKWLDVKAVFAGELQSRVMVPVHRGFANIGYKTRNKRWMADATISVFGQARLPQNILPDGSLSTDGFSQTYALVNAQITHVYHSWEFYLGGENIGNFVQRNPIIDAENPFSSTFDATRVWAPVVGMNIYAGFRFSIAQPKEEE